MRTFAELEKDKDVTAEEVAEVLEGYSSSSAAVSYQVVIGLIDRTKPDQAQRERIRASAQKGGTTQARRGFHRDAVTYDSIARYVDSK